MISRRLFLRTTAAAGAVGATVAAPAIGEAAQNQTPEQKVLAAWAALCLALEDILPMDGRLFIVGNHRLGQQPNFTVESVVERVEQVHPKVALPVERVTKFIRFKNGGSQSMEGSRV